MNFLKHFGKTSEGKIIILDIFTFNNLFILLLNENFSYDDAMTFIIAKGELNAYVSQNCIHNNSYLSLEQKFINPEEAGRRSMLHEIALSFIN